MEKELIIAIALILLAAFLRFLAVKIKPRVVDGFGKASILKLNGAAIIALIIAFWFILTSLTA